MIIHRAAAPKMPKPGLMGIFRKRWVLTTVTVLCLLATFSLYGRAKLEAGSLYILNRMAGAERQQMIDPHTYPSCTDHVVGAREGELDPAGDADLRALLTRYTRDNQVELPLVVALIKIESGFDPRATSRAGARGLMQLMPRTARYMGLTVHRAFDERLDPAKNMEAGIRYLRKLLDMFDNPVDAIAAYNAGPTAVRRGLPSNTETLRHVYKVMRLKHAYEKSVERMHSDIDLMLQKCESLELAKKPTRASHS